MADGNWVTSVLPDFIAGAFSTWSQKAMNEANAREAQKNRDFQERMSNTAIQRSMADYRAAGLNPGLAYDRTASSPGGAQAVMGAVDPINNARTSSRFRQEMEIARRQSDREDKVNQATVDKLKAERAATEQAMRFSAINQPWENAYKRATAALQEYLLPGARNQAKFDEITGLLTPITNSAGGMTRAIGQLFPKFKFDGKPQETIRETIMGKGYSRSTTRTQPREP